VGGRTDLVVDELFARIIFLEEGEEFDDVGILFGNKLVRRSRRMRERKLTSLEYL
jgi:hypothetical protein